MGGGDGVGHRGWNWHWVQPPKDYQTMIVPVNSLFNYDYWKMYWQQVNGNQNFLVADTQLFKGLCPSVVSRSVCPLVRPKV